MDRRSHWDSIYIARPTTSLAWYQPHLRLSLELLQGLGLPQDSPIIDIGGGDCTLVDDLIDLGYTNLTVLDVSGQALARSRERLAERAAQVTWLEVDVTLVDLPPAAFRAWHDRAVFHFLSDPLERGLYILALRKSLAPGGYLILASFALDGPQQCSDLPVIRYSPETLAAELGPHFKLLTSAGEIHRTPWGSEQRFQYSLFQHRET